MSKAMGRLTLISLLLFSPTTPKNPAHLLGGVSEHGQYLHRARTEAILDVVYNAMAGGTPSYLYVQSVFYPTLLDRNNVCDLTHKLWPSPVSSYWSDKARGGHFD